MNKDQIIFGLWYYRFLILMVVVTLAISWGLGFYTGYMKGADDAKQSLVNENQPRVSGHAFDGDY